MAKAPRRPAKSEAAKTVVKTTLALPVDLHRRLGALAALRGTSVNDLLVKAAAGVLSNLIVYERSAGGQVEPGAVEPAAGGDAPPPAPVGPATARFLGSHPIEAPPPVTGLTVAPRAGVILVPGGGLGAKASA